MFLEHQISIRMIPEGSCDTEEVIVNAENSTLPPQEQITF